MFDESAAIEETNNESTSFELRTILTTSEPTITKITTINPITIGLTTEPTTSEPTSKSIGTKCMSKKLTTPYKDSDSSNKTSQKSWNTAMESATPEAEVEPSDKPPDNNDVEDSSATFLFVHDLVESWAPVLSPKCQEDFTVLRYKTNFYSK